MDLDVTDDRRLNLIKAVSHRTFASYRGRSICRQVRTFEAGSVDDCLADFAAVWWLGRGVRLRGSDLTALLNYLL